MPNTPQVLTQEQVAQINSRASQVAYAGWLTAGVAVIALVAIGQLGVGGGIFVFCVGLLCTVPVRNRDKARRTTSITYPSADDHFATIQRAFEDLAEAKRIWHVESQQQNWDWKRQAGANSLVSRKQVQVGRIAPPFISTNVSICGVDTGHVKLFFFPDAILVYERGQYQAASYDSLRTAYSPSRFIDPSPPNDAEIIGYTWQYVNKNGGPDRRFSNNRQIPLASYGVVRIMLSSGIDLHLQVSNRTLATNFATTINAIVHPESTNRRSSTGNQRRSGSRKGSSGGKSRGRTRPPRAHESSKSKSAREVLGVTSDASRNDIIAAYRKMARMYHPDKVAGLGPEFGELAERRMKEINAAYAKLLQDG